MKSSVEQEFLELARKHSWIGVEYILRGGFRKEEFIPFGEVHKNIHKAIDKLKHERELLKKGLISAEEVKRGILIQLPRDHSKTTCVLGRILWELGNNPNLLIKIVCESEDNAKKRIGFLRQHIERNKRLHKLFPHLQPDPNASWSATQLYVKRDLISPDPSVEAAGVLGSHTGSHSVIVVFDDIIGFRNAYVYPENIKKIEHAVKENWLNILTDDGWFIMIFTPWTKDDVTLKMKEEKHLYYVFEAMIDDKLTPVWPEKYDREKLLKKKEEIGDEAFARQFQGRVVDPRSHVFNSKVVDDSIDHTLELGSYPKDSLLFVGVDLGHRQKSKSPETAIFVLAVDRNGIRIPVDIIVGNFSSVRTAQEIIDVYLKYRPELILVENNGYQESLLEWISLVWGKKDLPIEGYFTGAQKMDLNRGIPSMAVEFEKGLWRIPSNKDHSDECDCGLCKWIKQLKAFPVGKTDIVMASFFAREAYRKLYGDMSVGIRVIEIERDDDFTFRSL